MRSTYDGSQYTATIIKQLCPPKTVGHCPTGEQVAEHTDRTKNHGCQECMDGYYNDRLGGSCKLKPICPAGKFALPARPSFLPRVARWLGLCRPAREGRRGAGCRPVGARVDKRAPAWPRKPTLSVRRAKASKARA